MKKDILTANVLTANGRNTIFVKKTIKLFLVYIFILTTVSRFVFISKNNNINTEKPSNYISENNNTKIEEPTDSIDENNNTETEEPIRYLNGKNISFLGDSITTFEGISNNVSYNSTIGDNAVWYTSSKLDVNDTYWKRTIDNFNLNLIVNNAWSGAWCSSLTVSSGCNTRATQLHNNSGVTPDIIVVYIGINDLNCKVELGNYNNADDIYNEATDSYIGDTSKFSQSYATMIHKMKRKYTDADIYVCNLLPNNINNDTLLLNRYNSYVSKIADEFDCNLVDFYNDSGITKNNLATYTFEGLHPNASGHALMADCLQNKLLEKYQLK